MRTSGVTGVAAVPSLGEIVSVVPRASLLWKPRPAFTKYSVLFHGPSTSDSLGDASDAVRRPLFAAIELATSKR